MLLMLQTMKRVLPGLLFRHAFLLIAASWVSFYGHAQSLFKTNYISEGASHNVSPSDTARLLQKLRSALTFYEQYPDSAAAIAKTGFEQSHVLRCNRGMALSSVLLGKVAQNNGQFDSSIFFFTRGIFYAKKDSAATAKFYNNIANSYFFKGSYQAALENYNLALQQPWVLHGDSSQVYLNIALIWARMGAGEQSRMYLGIAEKIAARTHDTSMLISLYGQRAELDAMEQQVARAAEQLEWALAAARKTNREEAIVALLNQLTHLYLDQQRVDKAMIYTQEALTILKRYPGAYNFHRYHAQHNLGLIYSHLKNYRHAERLLQQTFAVAEATGLKDLILHMEPDMAAVYAQNGKYDLAYKHTLHYARLKDSILEQQRKIMLELWQKNIVAQKDKSLLLQKLQIAAQNRRLERKNIWIAATLIAAALLCIIFVTLTRSYRRKHRLQRELVLKMEQSTEIDRLKARVKGEEQERNRLAQELHDGIASQLWAIRLNVEGVQQNAHDKDKDKLGQIYRQLDETTQEIRKTAHNLMPDLLLQYGLASALESLSGKLNASSVLEVAFQQYGVIPRMNEDIELSLYRMIQELSQNVLKHAAGATQLLIQLSCTDNLLNITIEDNGAGFYSEQLRDRGIGLNNIEQRVHTLRGHFDIKSAPGRGTTAYLEFEIQHLL